MKKQKKQKKQSLLNTIITILVLILIVMVGSIIYEEKININKQTAQNNTKPTIQENENVQNENVEEKEEEKPVEEEKQEDEKEEQPVVEENKDNEEFVGEEENQVEKEPQMTKDERAISLVKKEWGEDDSVTFSIVKKKGTKYYVAVKSDDSRNIWYEVDTETWEVSEY